MKVIKDAFAAITKKFKADKKLLCILLVGIAGMFLILFADFGGSDDTSETEKEQTTQTQTQTESRDEYTYVEDVEKRLSKLISSIDGAGKTKVMVTLENGVEQIYATQDKTQSSSSSSIDSGGQNVEESFNKEDEYIIIKSSDDSETGLILKIVQPSIRGVAIVCEGADSTVVKKNIVEAVTAVTGISSAKVSIAKMADNQNTED